MGENQQHGSLEASKSSEEGSYTSTTRTKLVHTDLQLASSQPRTKKWGAVFDRRCKASRMSLDDSWRLGRAGGYLVVGTGYSSSERKVSLVEGMVRYLTIRSGELLSFVNNDIPRFRK